MHHHHAHISRHVVMSPVKLTVSEFKFCLFLFFLKTVEWLDVVPRLNHFHYHCHYSKFNISATDHGDDHLHWWFPVSAKNLDYCVAMNTQEVAKLKVLQVK